MQEIKISYSKKDEKYPNLIDTDSEEVRFLWTILQDLAPWKNRKSIPENLPVKILGETFTLTLKETPPKFKKPKKEINQSQRRTKTCVRCGNDIVFDASFAYEGISPLCQDCYEKLTRDN